jgi:hypothetical protein
MNYDRRKIPSVPGQPLQEKIMDHFSDVIGAWESFYILAGTAAATLIGLLFVSVSIHINAFRRQASGNLQLFATLTFNCFFYILFISILFLIPGLTPQGLGIPLLLLGVLGFLNAFHQQRKAKIARQEQPGGNLAGKFNLPIISLVGLFLMGIGIVLEIEASFYGLVAVILLLLISASLNAWTLLVEIEG